MFARSVSSNSLVAPQPCDNTSAEDMAAKKARTEVVNYTDMALEKINIKEIGKSKNGSPTMLVLHDELAEAGVSHRFPRARSGASWHAPPLQFAAAGQPQAPDAPTYRPENIRVATLSRY